MEETKKTLRAQILNAIAHEVEKTYRNFTWIYREHPRFKKCPIIFRPLSGKWGLFDPENRTIVLNEDLYFKGGWEPLKGVLMHEAVHQLVFQLHPERYSSEPPHGPAFQKLAARLRLEKFYVRASMKIESPDSLPPNPLGKKSQMDSEHPVLVKVKKLLALAGSDSPHEASLALTAAERLLARHNLELPEKDPEKEPFERWRISLGKKARNAHNIIASILMNHFFVECVFTRTYDPLVREQESQLEILGRPVNLSMAEHVFHYLMERSESLWQAYRPTARRLGENGQRARAAFIANLLSGFAEKLEKEKRTSSPESSYRDAIKEKALVESSREELKGFVKDSWPSLIKVRYGQRASSPLAAAAGRRAGNELPLHRPVPGGASGIRGRLES